MLIMLLGMIINKNRARSTNALIVTFIANILGTLADAACYCVYGPNVPDAIVFIIYFVAYCFGTLSLLLFTRYWYFYIIEKVALSKWFRIVPIVLLSLTFIYMSFLCWSEKIFYVVDGRPIINGGMPFSVTLVHLAFLIYFPVVALLKRKQIGNFSILLLGSFGVFPFAASILSVCVGIKDYSCAAAAFSLIIIYIMLQNHQIQEDGEINHIQLSVLNSLAEIFYSLHVIDLVQDTVVEFNAKNEVKELVNHTNGAVHMMRHVISSVVSDEYKYDALEFTNLITVRSRMNNKRIISKEFVGSHIGWFLASFITMETDGAGEPTKVIFTTRIIDEEKKQKELLIVKTQTDEMTGLLNRRAYEEDIYALNDIPEEENFNYISLDVNGLKLINDTKGHTAGDELIIGACECMKKNLGPYGKLYRIGGDEFVVILFCKHSEVKHILADFDKTISGWSGKLIDGLSISYGWVSKNESPDASVRQLGAIAENRMYEAKSAHYRKVGVDRRGQQDAHKALCQLYTKILKINITEDSYLITQMNDSERSIEKGFSEKISDWLTGFGNSGQIHPDDLQQYLRLTDLQFMRNYFALKKTSLHIFYRRKFDDGYKQVMMEIIPANDYTNENQSLFLYVKNIDK